MTRTARPAAPRYYAVSWVSGRGTTYQRPDGGTEPYADVHAFPSRAARDAWVAEGCAYVSGRDFRESATAGDSIVRAAVAQERELDESGFRLRPEGEVVRFHAVCAEPGCPRPLYAQGRCEAHYRRERRGSDATGPVREPLPAARKLRGTALTVEGEVADRIEREAERRGVPVAQVVREVLAAWRPPPA